MLTISNSERKQFKHCRRMWHYNSPNRLNLKPRKPQTALWLGTAVHEALDAYYGKGIDLVVAYDAAIDAQLKEMDNEPDDMDETIELGRQMLIHYKSYYKNEDIKVLATELQFKINIKGLGYFAGTWDGFIIYNKKVYVFEHKTYKQEMPAGFMQLDDQTRIYPAIAQILSDKGKLEHIGIAKGTRIYGVLYNGLRKKIPTVPALLKNGSISKNKAIDTTAAVYRQAVIDAGLCENDYSDIIGTLESKAASFFNRFVIDRSYEEFAAAYKHLVTEFEVMSAKDVPIYHNPSHDCSWRCSYKELCMLECAGVELDPSVIQGGFEQAPLRNEAYKIEESI